MEQPGIPGLITLNGVAPQSPPNEAAAGYNADAASAIAVAEGTKSFALSSFYYGCASETDEGEIDLAEASNITVTGYGSTAAGAKPVVSQVFDFKPVSVRTFILAIRVIISICNPPRRNVVGWDRNADRGHMRIPRSRT